jgi:hypothetical protein
LRRLRHRFRRLCAGTGQHDFLCAVAQFDGDAPHLGEVAVDFLWKGVRGVTAAGDLGDMKRKVAHPLGVGDILKRADNGPEVSSDGGLQRQQQ